MVCFVGLLDGNTTGEKMWRLIWQLVWVSQLPEWLPEWWSDFDWHEPDLVKFIHISRLDTQTWSSGKNVKLVVSYRTLTCILLCLLVLSIQSSIDLMQFAVICYRFTGEQLILSGEWVVIPIACSMLKKCIFHQLYFNKWFITAKNVYNFLIIQNWLAT